MMKKKNNKIHLTLYLQCGVRIYFVHWIVQLNWNCLLRFKVKIRYVHHYFVPHKCQLNSFYRIPRFLLLFKFPLCAFIFLRRWIFIIIIIIYKFVVVFFFSLRFWYFVAVVCYFFFFFFLVWSLSSLLCVYIIFICSP